MVVDGKCFTDVRQQICVFENVDGNAKNHLNSKLKCGGGSTLYAIIQP